MHIRCPHCRNPIEVVEPSSADDVKCPSCGSNFSLIDPHATHSYPAALEAQPHPSAARRVAHFELLEQLGMGAFGTVWKARDIELDRVVAVKIPRKEQLTPEETEKFVREARAAAQLRHPNIVSVHEVGREAATIYIVSDLVEGVTLADWLKRHEPSPRDAALVCRKIAEALHHAHEQGVIHRDLKPSNIMLDRSGEPHLMDFGLAKREAGEVTMTIDGQILGTPAYMSPEQARGDAHQVDRRTDVYSLGVILFQLLTGEMPFRGNLRMLLHQLLTEEPPSPRKLNAAIPRDLETICLKCLEKDPKRRFLQAQEVADELQRWLSGTPIRSRPISGAERGWRWVKRNPVVSGLSAAVVLALAAGTAVSTSFSIVATQRAADLGAALKRVEDERQRANVQADKAERERRKADEALAETRAAIDQYVDAVDRSELLKDPQFQTLRRELLAGAQEYYQRLLEHNEAAASDRSNLASIMLHLGVTQSLHGGVKDKAEQSLQKSAALGRALFDEDPQSAEYVNRAAWPLIQLGFLYNGMDRRQEAIDAARQARAILAPYPEGGSNDPQWDRFNRLALGYSHEIVGFALRSLAETEDDESKDRQSIAKEFQRAHEVFSAAAADYPDSVGFANLAQRAAIALASLRPDDAAQVETARKAMDVAAQTLKQSDAASWADVNEHVMTQLEFAQALVKAQERGEAEEILSKAIRNIDAAVEAYPLYYNVRAVSARQGNRTLVVFGRMIAFKRRRSIRESENGSSGTELFDGERSRGARLQAF